MQTNNTTQKEGFGSREYTFSGTGTGGTGTGGTGTGTGGSGTGGSGTGGTGTGKGTGGTGSGTGGTGTGTGGSGTGGSGTGGNAYRTFDTRAGLNGTNGGDLSMWPGFGQAVRGEFEGLGIA